MDGFLWMDAEVGIHANNAKRLGLVSAPSDPIPTTGSLNDEPPHLSSLPQHRTAEDVLL